MNKKSVFVLTAALLLGAAILTSRAQSTGTKDIPPDVVKVFKEQCTHCHSGLLAPKGLNLGASKIASAIDAPSKEMPALKLIDTANPEAGYLLKKIEGAEGIGGVKMPKGREMPAADLQVLKAWLLSLKAK